MQRGTEFSRTRDSAKLLPESALRTRAELRKAKERP
jgi:hypothetical protein